MFSRQNVCRRKRNNSGEFKRCYVEQSRVARALAFFAVVVALQRRQKQEQQRAALKSRLLLRAELLTVGVVARRPHRAREY